MDHLSFRVRRRETPKPAIPAWFWWFAVLCGVVNAVAALTICYIIWKIVT